MAWDVSDLDGLIIHLGAAGPKAEALTEKVVHKTGFDAVAYMQALVPVDTGATKNSVGVDFDESGFEAGPTTNYSPFLEYGTSKMSPRPFVRPGFEKAIEPLPDVLAQVGEKALE